MASEAQSPPRRLTDPVEPPDHLRGDGVVTLVEYGDYECPDCMRSAPMVNRLLGDYTGRLTFVFRHFPLTSIHPHAAQAAQAAEAAGAQGKFWQMHDLLYDRDNGLEIDDLDRMALRLGLEIYRFQGDLSGGRYARRVERDLASGRRSGVRGTPTFFVNGLAVSDDESELRDAVERALQAST